MTRGSKRKSKPTSRDVAALAGVAQSTVSAAMSGNRLVAPETKDRIERAMRELDYHPNAGARTLRTSRTNFIALVIELSSEVDGVETVPYIDAVIEGARKRDYDVVLSLPAEGTDGLRRLLGRSICDGVLMMDTRRDDQRIAAAVEFDQPIVLVGEPLDAQGLDAVDFDGAGAAALLVNDLADTGHDRIIVVGEEPLVQSHAAFAAFYDSARETAHRRSLEFEELVPASGSWRDVNALGPSFKDAAQSKLGIVARNHRGVEWTMRLLMQTGLRVGVDVSVSALCTDDVAVSFGLPLTNVSPRPREMMDLAVDLLFARIDGESRPAVMNLLPPEGLVRRESTVRFDLL